MEARRLVGTMTFPVLILVAWLWLSGGQFAGVMPHAQHAAQPNVHVASVQHVQHDNVTLTYEKSREVLHLLLIRALPGILDAPSRLDQYASQHNLSFDAAELTASP
ncbi:MAG TPA: hypothetical protein VFY10_05105 [Dehalococcoidia bacterium]|nr:hypothetical protein [Dehalococcoidia bacterium]